MEHLRKVVWTSHRGHKLRLVTGAQAVSYAKEYRERLYREHAEAMARFNERKKKLLQ